MPKFANLAWVSSAAPALKKEYRADEYCHIARKCTKRHSKECCGPEHQCIPFDTACGEYECGTITVDDWDGTKTLSCGECTEGLFCHEEQECRDIEDACGAAECGSAAVDTFSGNPFSCGSCERRNAYCDETQSCTAVIWKTQIPRPRGIAMGSGHIYVTKGDTLVALNSSDGTSVWHTDIENIYGIPSVGLANDVYVANSVDDALYSVSAGGAIQWHLSVPDDIRTNLSIRSDGNICLVNYHYYYDNLLVISPDGEAQQTIDLVSAPYDAPNVGKYNVMYQPAGKTLIAFSSDGYELWEYYAGSTIYSSPAIGSADGLFFVTADNTVHALNADGTTRWTLQNDVELYNQPVIGTDSILYFITDDHVYAIDTGSGGPANSPWPMYRHDPQRTNRGGE